MKLNGSQIVLEVLKEQGVDTIFGYPGGTILNIFDELYKYVKSYSDETAFLYEFKRRSDPGDVRLFQDRSGDRDDRHL